VFLPQVRSDATGIVLFILLGFFLSTLLGIV
jgi:hypothetical protein